MTVERGPMATIQEALASLPDKDVRHIISISGGKDSAALAVYMRQEFPEIEAEYVFCDTGCELEETYDYIEKLEALLGIEVQRLNALDNLGVEKKHGRNPFDIYLKEMYGGFLPSPRSRWCTRALKIEPFEAHVGSDQAYSYIGIRADEDRDGYTAKKPPKLSEQPNITPVYPFRDADIVLSDVKRILDDSGLGLPEYYKWRTRSGCYFCFYQQVGEWQRLREEHPDLFQKAKGYEQEINGKIYTWVDGRSLMDIELVGELRPLPSPDEVEGCAICHV